MTGSRLPLHVMVFLALLLAVVPGSTIFAADETVEDQVKKQTMPQRMQNMLKQVKLDEVPAETAFKWWKANSQIPLVIDWKQLADDGISPTTAITLDLEMVPCHQVLRLIMQQASPGRPMVVQITPWYVEVMTRQTANERLVTKTYRVRDLLWSIHDRVPSDDDEDDRDSGRDRRSSSRSSPSDRGDRLAEVVRTSIEPDVWKENGGNATIVYHDGRLVVRAPLYVHNQIELPDVAKPVPHVASRDAAQTSRTDSDAQKAD